MRSLFFKRGKTFISAAFFLFFPCLGLSQAWGAEALKLRIGFTAVTIKSQVEVNNLFAEYIGKKAGMETKIVFAPLYSDMSRMLKNEEVDIAYVCGMPYVIDHDSFGVELLAVPAPAVFDGKPTYQSYIVVRKDSPFRSFQDLKGTRFAFSDPLSNSGKLYATYFLAEGGHKVEDYFHSYFFTYGHSNSIEAVAMNLADAASVDGYIWELHQKIDPAYSKETRVIHKSPDFPFTPFVARKSLPDQTKKKLREVLLEMRHDPEGMKILDGLFLRGFVLLDDKDYDVIRKMLEFVDRFYGTKEGG